MNPAGFPANTASSIGSVQPCGRINENNFVDADEVVADTLEFNVTAKGVPASNAMTGYGYTIIYNEFGVTITQHQPVMIGTPTSLGDPVPDTNNDNQFVVNVSDTSGPAESGSGILDILRVTSDLSGAGVYPLTLANASHVDTTAASWAPDSLFDGTVLVDQGGCSAADVEMVSLDLASTGSIPVGSNATVTIDEVLTNVTAPALPVNTDARTEQTVPTGCTINGSTGVVALNAGVGTINQGQLVNHQETPTLNCSTAGAYQMPIEACAIEDDPSAVEYDLSNNCLVENLVFEVTAVADGALSLDAAAPPTITANTLFPITVDMPMSNSGPYQPAGFTLSKSAVVPPGCSMTPPGSTNHSLSGTTTAYQEVWYLNCAPGGPYNVEFQAALAPGIAQIDDPDISDDTDSEVLVLSASPDADADGVYDLDEPPCGVPALVSPLMPERLDGAHAGVDDDGDTLIDEALPGTAGSRDCDGDGFTGTAEAHVFQSTAVRNQDRCGPNEWPADLAGGMFSANRLNTLDLATFLGPVRHYNTDVGANPGNVRWDVIPGSGVLTFDINIQDLAYLVSQAPAMFHPMRAFNGPMCS